MTMINSQKLELIKYCYTKGKVDLRQTLVDLIKTCDNDDLIDFTIKMFDKLIMPYFTINRQVFNRIRPYFMNQLMISLLENLNGAQYNKQAYLDNYYIWCEKAKVFSTIVTFNIYQNITKKY